MKGDSLFAFVAGAAAGLTLGLLFAPEKGEETRRKLRETAGDAADSAGRGPGSPGWNSMTSGLSCRTRLRI